MFITRHGRKILVEQIKYAHLSSGYIVYWFRDLHPVLDKHEFIVAVHDPQGSTAQYKSFSSAYTASLYYLNWLTTYA